MSDLGNPPDVPDACDGRQDAHRTAWLVVAAIAVASLAPVLMLRGMSLDGVVYATIARNLAAGLGDAWHLVYASPSATFHEHPPLGFVLESYLFRALGDQWWVERLYSCLSALPMAALIVLVWRRLYAEHRELRGLAWLPVALWVLMPAWAWIYRNNYLENTLGAFTLLSVYASLCAMSSPRRWAAWCVLAAAAIGAAVLTKGPVGMFPLVVPAAYWIAARNVSWRRAATVQGVLCIALAVGALVILSQPEPREFFATYLRQQVLDSVQGHREMNPSRLGHFHLLLGLVRDLWLTAGLAAGLVLAGRHWGAGQASRLSAPGRFAVLMALCASLPIMISPKQSPYYTAPSWPLFALALACWSSESVGVLIQRALAQTASGAWQRAIRRGSVATMTLCIGLSPLWYGWYLRDRDLVTDVDRIAEVVGPHATIDISPKLAKHWALHAYLFRRHYISVEQGCPSAAYHLEPAEVGRPSTHVVSAAAAQLGSFVLTRRENVAVAVAPEVP